MATVEESIERAGAQLTQIVTAAKVPNIFSIPTSIWRATQESAGSSSFVMYIDSWAPFRAVPASHALTHDAR